jgi:anti-repressor protein
MNNLKGIPLPPFTVKIIDQDLNQEMTSTVNARELHGKLQVGKDFTNWIKGRINKYEFVQGVDFIHLTKTGEMKNVSIYYLTVDMAKELSMIENNAIGRIARRYFIAMEKADKPISIEDMLLEAHNKLKAERLKLEKSDFEKKQIYNEFVEKMKIEGYRNFKDSADIIDIKGFGRNTMLKFLRDKKWFTKTNRPYRVQIEMGRFVVKNIDTYLANDIHYRRDVVMITEKGIIDIMLQARNTIT